MINIKQLKSDIAGPIIFQGNVHVERSINLTYNDTTKIFQTIGSGKFIGLNDLNTSYSLIAESDTVADIFYVRNDGAVSSLKGYWQGSSKILYINPNGTTANLFVGQNSGNDTMTGVNNTGVGVNTLTKNTGGNSNIGIGYLSLYNNILGNQNTAIGVNSMVANVNGYYNVAIGLASLSSNIDGFGNTAIGWEALSTSTQANENIAIGYRSMSSATTAYYSGNIAIGSSTLENTSTSEQVAIGYYALKLNTTGFSNTAIGSNSLTSNTTGFGNVSIGNYTLTSNTIGIKNVAVGYQSFYTNTVSSSNVGLGYQAGYYETGSNKLFIDNTARTDETDGRAKALIYGVFAATTATQELYINANTGRFGLINIKSDTSLNTILWNSTTAPIFPTGTSNTFIGNNDSGTISVTTGDFNFIGGSFTSNSLTTGTSNIFISTYVDPNITTGSNNIFFGGSITTNTSINQSIAFNGKPTLNNQVIFGDPNIARYKDFYFGQGMITPDSYGKFDVNFFATSNITGETDKNATVSNFIINGSQGTGSGNGGNISFKVALPGTTGTSQNTLINKLIIKGDTGYIGINTDTPSTQLHIKGNSRHEHNLYANILFDIESAYIQTTDATQTTLYTIPITSDEVVTVEARINSKKISGAGVGNIGDGNGYIRTVKVKNVGGTVTMGSIQSSFTSEDITAFNATFTISGTNLLVRVNGSVINTVDWSCFCLIHRLKI